MRKSRTKHAEKAASDNEDDQPLIKPSSSNDKEYEVDKILNERSKKGKKEYLVRWKGFSDKDDTWESEENLNCPQIIAQFKVADEKAEKNLKGAKKQPKLKERGRKSKSPNKKRKKDESDDEEDLGNSSNDTECKEKQKGEKSENSKKKLKTTKDLDDDDDDTDTEYEVEKILEVHHKKNGTREFLVHWKGYPKSDDSWEPEGNLNCQDLINKFLEKVSKAKSSSPRETRVNRKPTDRYVLNAPDSGRKLSGRNSGPRRTYYENE